MIEHHKWNRQTIWWKVGTTSVQRWPPTPTQLLGGESTYEEQVVVNKKRKFERENCGKGSLLAEIDKRPRISRTEPSSSSEDVSMSCDSD